ncbi:MAG: hypothetical protein HYT90_02945 [Candidatus Omnitrophica bacterium]|nr:hypothetical protein [Candidatus Omnitrophota bacterium]
MARRDLIILAGVGWLLVSGLSGCESLQKKLTRKPKGPQAAPTPLIQFQDYSRAMTPLDRYRKHYLIFDYWNSELLDALQSRPLNSKRYRHASSEALGELQALQGLLAEGMAERLTPFLESRAKLDARLQRGSISDSQVPFIQRELELQTIRFQRDFFWRKAEDHLKPQEQAPAAP